MDIPSSVFTTYYTTADDFIDKNFGVNCVIYYPAKRVDCENCIFDPFTKKSSNKYQSGGPISFTNGICPYCNGEGFRSSVDSDTIKMRAYYDKKSWVKIPLPINLPDGAVQTIGHMSDLPKVLRCTEMQLHSDIAGQGTFKYMLSGEPVPHGFGRNKYFIAMWVRV